jgi:hypothetical protein
MFVEHLSLTKVAQQSVTKITYLILMNLVTPKARAKHEPFVQQTGLRFTMLDTPTALACHPTKYVNKAE